MTGRLTTWSGGLIVAAAVVGLGAYFAVAGFRLNDTVGVIGSGVGIAGLGLAVYGRATDRRGGTDQKPPPPGRNSAEFLGQNNVVNQATGNQYINQPITIVGSPADAPQSPLSPQGQAVRHVQERLRAGDLAAADAELSASASVLRDGALLWYWKARVALARDRTDVAGRYIDKALGRDPRDEPSIALKIKVLLLSPEPDDRARARTLASGSRGIGDRLDTWLTCLQAEGMFEPGPRTATELDTKCPFPTEDRQ
ncbi:hypothetical protein OHR68_36270 [Spirillospora sp. NBC_00431]